MTGSPPSPPRAGAAARQRIVEAAVRCLVRAGVAEASMAAIASEGAVSKALLHYHYAHRGQLMAEVATQLGRRIVARERAAMDAASGSAAVDALWAWLEGELARGELRALLELGMQPDEAIRTATTTAGRSRERSATETVERLFEGLGLAPRMPPALLAGASLAFIDGLATGAPSTSRDSRVSFDLFWLALLSLAE